MSTTDLPSVVSRLVTWLETQKEDDEELMLAQPASAEQLAALEDAIGVPLPQDCRATYRVADGQSMAAGVTLFPAGYWWLGAGDMMSEIETMTGLYEGEGSEEFGPEWWHPGLLPFAGNGGGDLLCLDVTGAFGGTVGRIVEFIHDDYPFQTELHPGPFGRWLSEYVGALEADSYYLDGGRVQSY